MTDPDTLAIYLSSMWTGYRALTIAARPEFGLVVGLVDDDDGSVRIYFDALSLDHHLHVSIPEVVTAIRDAWELRPLALPLTPLGWCPCQGKR